MEGILIGILIVIVLIIVTLIMITVLGAKAEDKLNDIYNE
jgi:hypothetical protein